MERVLHDEISKLEFGLKKKTYKTQLNCVRDEEKSRISK